MARRKEHHEEHPDERWLVTYADVLTLMYVLFMVLFSISVVNTSKFEALKDSLSESFSGGVPEGGTGVLEGQALEPQPQIVDGTAQTIAPELPSQRVNLVNATPEQALETSQLEKVQRLVERRVDEAGLSKAVTTGVNERGLAIRVLTDGLFFDSGSANLKPAASAVLQPVATGVRDLQNPVRVEGHTDAVPISTGQFPSNWELSTARAGAVVRFLERGGMARTRLQATGFADTRPIESNSSAAGRGENRRVEILVLRLQGAPGGGPDTTHGG